MTTCLPAAPVAIGASIDRPRDARPPLHHVAWRCGRLVNHLSHVMQVCDLTCDPQYVERARRTWLELGLTVRGFAAAEPAKSELQSTVLDECDGWLERFRSAWHAEWLDGNNQEIELLLGDEEDASLCREVDDMLQRVDETMEQIRRAIERGMEPPVIATYRLAQLVDRAVHPLPAHRIMRKHRPEVQPNSAGWAAAIANVRQPRTWHLPVLPIKYPASWPPHDWIREVEVRWAEHPLSLPRLGDGWIGCTKGKGMVRIIGRLEKMFDGAADAAAAAAASDGYGEGVDGAAEAEIAPADKDSTTDAEDDSSTDAENDDAASSDGDSEHDALVPPNSNYLGLVIQDGVIRRAGRKGEISPGRLRLRLVERLAQARGGYISRSELEQLWEELGGRPNPETTTVDSEISRARKDLRRLGLDIENNRNIGWRLVESSEG